MFKTENKKSRPPPLPLTLKKTMVPTQRMRPEWSSLKLSFWYDASVGLDFNKLKIKNLPIWDKIEVKAHYTENLTTDIGNRKGW